MNTRMLLRMCFCAPLAMLVLGSMANGQFYSGDQGSGLYGQGYQSHEEPYGYARQLAAIEGSDVKQVSYNYQNPQSPSCTSCGDSACSGNCNSCNDCLNGACPLDDCNRCPNWYSGTEFTFLALNTSSASLTRSSVSNGADGVDLSSSGDLDGFTYAPRIWLGRQFGRWGVVARYWQLSDNNSQGNVFQAPLFNPASSFSQAIQMQALDLEATRSVCYCDWKFDGFLGARYASFNNNSTTSAVGAFNGGADIATSAAAAGTDFSGTGLTFALQARKPLFCTNVHLFASGRGSVLWGNADSYAHTETTAASFPGAVAINASGAAASGSTEMWIGEFQLGAQWEYQLTCLPAVAFFRTAFEYQIWDIQGSGLATSFSTSTANATNAFASAQSGASNVQLYGVSVGTGLTW